MLNKIIQPLLNLLRYLTGKYWPYMNTQLNYFIHNRRFANLKNPVTFCEKLLYLKLSNYNNNPLVKKCADKYHVREYIQEHGYGFLLNDLLAVYDDPSKINLEKLPSRFVLKLNTGAGCNYICTDKLNIDKQAFTKQINHWWHSDYYINYSEYQYDVKKYIIVEKYLEIKDDPALPEDYKIYCFGGVPKAILCLCNRDDSGCPLNGFFMSPEWEFLGNVDKYKPIESSKIPPKPKHIQVAVDAAAKLAAPFPFVRIDFYFPDLEANPVFGEMTFTPGAGIYVSEISLDNKDMGSYIKLND